MQQILYEQSPYIVTDYRPDFEAYNTDKWEGYIAHPGPERQHAHPAVRQRRVRQLPEHRAEDGRRRPRRAAAAPTLSIAIVVAVVVVVIAIVLIVRSRRPKATEE